MEEDYPEALSKGTVKSINSSIVQHWVCIGLQVDPNQAFNIIIKSGIISPNICTQNYYLSPNQEPLKFIDLIV